MLGFISKCKRFFSFTFYSITYQPIKNGKKKSWSFKRRSLDFPIKTASHGLVTKDVSTTKCELTFRYGDRSRYRLDEVLLGLLSSANLGGSDRMVIALPFCLRRIDRDGGKDELFCSSSALSLRETALYQKQHINP